MEFLDAHKPLYEANGIKHNLASVWAEARVHYTSFFHEAPDRPLLLYAWDMDQRGQGACIGVLRTPAKDLPDAIWARRERCKKSSEDGASAAPELPTVDSRHNNGAFFMKLHNDNV